MKYENETPPNNMKLAMEMRNEKMKHETPSGNEHEYENGNEIWKMKMRPRQRI